MPWRKFLDSSTPSTGPRKSMCPRVGVGCSAYGKAFARELGWGLGGASKGFLPSVKGEPPFHSSQSPACSTPVSSTIDTSFSLYHRSFLEPLHRHLDSLVSLLHLLSPKRFSFSFSDQLDHSCRLFLPGIINCFTIYMPGVFRNVPKSQTLLFSVSIIKMRFQLSMMAHIFNAASKTQRQEDLGKFKVSLVYVI